MVWGYNYVLEGPVYKWAKPGFIVTAIVFAVVAVPLYIYGGWEAGNMVSHPLVIADVALALTGWWLHANNRLPA